LIDQLRNSQLSASFYQDFIYEPIQNYFSPYNDLVKKMSKRIGKDVGEITFVNGELLIDPNPYKEFFNVLVHLFRNCLDHGIEEESIRIGLGKTAQGNIGVAFSFVNINSDAKLKIIVQDDGAGINPEKIKNKLVSLYPDKNFDSLSDKEIIRKIFDPFFSTRDEVSELSGRGVGMSAIKDVVDAMGGQIEIESQVGIGSSFTFLLPRLAEDISMFQTAGDEKK
jgi:two-component system chemotaxis sensor kinase CheA